MKILFQGDSVTDAGRTASNYPNLGRGYPDFVAGQLGFRYPLMDFVVENRGIGGNRVVDLYQRWKVDAVNLAPDVISILIGINDTWHEFAHKNGVEPDRFEMVYRNLVSWTKKALPGVKLVLCEPFMLEVSKTKGDYKPGENWAPGDGWEEEMAIRRKMVKQIAEDSDSVFVPLQSVLNDALALAPAEHWLSDGVHPTAAGHALIADAWIKYAGPALGI